MTRSLTRALLTGAIAATALTAVVAPANAHRAVRSDAVIAWNANAGKAALAACISPSDDPLHESRLYAMMHVAIHDALNAIDRRSRPYAYDARREAGRLAGCRGGGGGARRAGPAARPAPAPFPPACIDAGVASVEADYAAALAAIPDGPAKTRGIELGQAAAAAILALRAADGSDTPLLDPATRRARSRASSASRPTRPFAFAPGLGERHAVRAAGTARSSVRVRPTR